jgi:translation initiation factor 3 subunit M
VSYLLYGRIKHVDSCLRDISYKYMLSYIRSLSSSSPNFRSAAVDAIAATLRMPSVFDFDPLFKLDAIAAAKDHELYSLLLIFINGNLAQFTSWEQSHSPAFEKYSKSLHRIGFELELTTDLDLDRAQLQRKIRLLTLASIGFKYIGKDLPYAEIASALEIDVSEVEKWVIDGDQILFISTFFV